MIDVEKDQRDPPCTAEELLRRYATGEREFRFAQLYGADVNSANLSN